tara:strand:+ start:448 stop:1119 length:672 start_codon:yes stop_codon:yes gene_type:complete
MKYFDSDFLNFFIELAANNHKAWFDENRKRYEKSVKKPFENFVNALILEIQKDDPSVQIKAKDAIFRINRDIRFSKDKSPYKLDRTAAISPKGRKDHSDPGFYVSLGPEKLMVGGGAYALPPETLMKLRTYIMAHPKEFETCINDKGFKSTYGELKGEENKRLPNKDLMEAAKSQPLLLRKQFYYMAESDADLVLSDKLLEHCMSQYQKGKIMKTFLRKAMSL